MIPAGVTGAFAAIALTFPIAGLTALLYRFPIPFGGYASGPEAVLLSLGAVVFYGVAMGGFVVVGLLGFAAGVVAERVARANGKSVVKMTVLFGLLVAFLAVFALAILDKVIGPW
jgi:hypothetical protein